MDVSPVIAEKIKNELARLDEMEMMLDGKPVKPSSCYYFGSSPVHVLYNINCPDQLKHTIENIIQRYLSQDEGSSYK
jgi:hypothetical protein